MNEQTKDAIAKAVTSAAIEASMARDSVNRLQAQLHAALSLELTTFETHSELWSDAVEALRPVGRPDAGSAPMPWTEEGMNTKDSTQSWEEARYQNLPKPVTPTLPINAATHYSPVPPASARIRAQGLGMGTRGVG